MLKSTFLWKLNFILRQKQFAHSLNRSLIPVMDQTFQNTKTSTPEDLILALNALLDTNRSFVMREVLGWEGKQLIWLNLFFNVNRKLDKILSLALIAS